jgi:hypothetical protein
MKIARFAIFLTGMMGLAMGGIMSISSLQSQQEDAVIKTNDSLKAQAQIFVDQFFGTLEAAKASAGNSNLSYVTQKGIVKLVQGVPSEIESLNTVSNDGQAAAETDLALEERLLKSLKSQVAINDLQISKLSLGTYSQSDVSAREGIFIATPIYKTTANGTDPTTIEKINVTLIDPSKAMASFAKATAGNRNSFLISKNGKVLAHSVGAYVGSDLRKIEGLKDTIDNLFLGAQTGSVGRYQAVDGTKEQVAFVRAGTYPFAIAAEQPAVNPVLSMGWFSEQINSGAARKSLGVIFILISAALALFSGISFWLSRELKKQIATNTNARLGEEATEEEADSIEALLNPSAIDSNQNSALNPSSASPTSSKISPPSMGAHLNGAADAKIELDSSPRYSADDAQAAAAAFVESRTQLVHERSQASENAKVITLNRDLEKEFTGRIQKVYAIESIEKELVQVSSELSNSPVLYFRYHRRNQTIHLSAVAGQVQIPNYAHMQAYVRKDIEQQVENLASEGKVASITNYGPISKLMIANLNIANYEAWTVTSDPEVSGQSKLVGVMVVVQPNFRGSHARPVLAKILREAGNYLYAQGNKLKPRYKHPEHELELNLTPNG